MLNEFKPKYNVLVDIIDRKIAILALSVIFQLNFFNFSLQLNYISIETNSTFKADVLSLHWILMRILPTKLFGWKELMPPCVSYFLAIILSLRKKKPCPPFDNFFVGPLGGNYLWRPPKVNQSPCIINNDCPKALVSLTNLYHHDLQSPFLFLQNIISKLTFRKPYTLVQCVSQPPFAVPYLIGKALRYTTDVTPRFLV